MEKMVKNGGESDPQDEDETPVSSTNLVRYYTCPLDQVKPQKGKLLELG